MQLPEFLRPFKAMAEQYIEQGHIHDIVFSGNTYQVQVFDSKTDKYYWAFLQLNAKGLIKDCFCSCEASELSAQCGHIAAAYLFIYKKHKLPLHQRFERSLWNCLCKLFAERLGCEQEVLLHPGSEEWSVVSPSGKKVFYIRSKNPASLAKLDAMLLQRRVETEETSLKFSNLHQEEIIRWREGRPSLKLSYELSFWNDIAKWLMLLQDAEHPYHISYEYSSKKIPNFLHANFSEVEVGFYLSEANLSLLIPAFGTVKSPLGVYNFIHEAISRITYDKSSGCLSVERPQAAISKLQKEMKAKKEKMGISIAGWLFVPNDGFYPEMNTSLTSTPQICGSKVASVLNDHYSTVESFLQGAKLHADPVSVSYTLVFDPKWNLRITCFLFNPGDLTQGASRFFGDWAYLDDDGFYKLQDMQFDQVEVEIPSKEVSDFVSQRRSWLNTQEGFHTYLTSIEAQLLYHLSKDNKLIFERKIAVHEAQSSKDFGQWIYIAGQGFYSKVSNQIGLPLRPNVVLSETQIPFFIRSNREELQIVPNFFSETCPVEAAGLAVELLKDRTIRVRPVYKLFPRYEGSDVRFFEEFAYVRGEGFHELPAQLKLPDKYRSPVDIESDQLAMFLTYELESLKDYIVSIDPHLAKPLHLALEAKDIHLVSQGSKPAYDLQLHYKSHSGEVSVSALWNAAKKKQRFVFSDAGLVDLEDARFNWLRLLNKEQIDKQNNTAHLSALELLRLNALDDIVVPIGSAGRNLLKELTEFKIPEPPDLQGFNCTLRPYQQHGVHWLWFIYSFQLAGLLCDDMGLGKTHQTMALLAGAVNKHKAEGGGKPLHFLVVCPTSVLYHWEEKIAAFLPGLRVCTFYGSERNLDLFHEEYDLLLTSYGILRLESAELSKIPFEIAIFDEIQIAKNYTSRVHSSLLTIQAKIRLGLTGTPIENRLRELKSLFDIVLPSYMPTESDYREFFVKPIEKESNSDRQGMLSRLIKPFVLRRRKKEVLLDLPEKSEEIAHCYLHDDQRRLYAELIEGSRRKLLDELQDTSNRIPYLHIFALLSGLKQICDHPAVYLKEPGEYKNYHSGKWDLFVELLREARESQQKVVVFSQYLAMLDIFESYLNELGIGFATIRGSTTNRGEQLARFAQDPSCEVFLGSLQAAGLGVDLTAASVVIHYDRWWNAARENQATDRVHRIGQVRGVQVFKLVTKGTFEEQIDDLISRKGKLMEEIVGIDDHEVLKRFDREDLIKLLRYEF
jgi:SNF2 family DNA or RNA helicase